MRIAVLGTPRSGTDPRTVRLVWSLAHAGHDVSFMSSGTVDARIEASATRITKLSTRWPTGAGRIGWLIRRLNPRAMRARNMTRHAASTLGELRPDLVYTTDADLARVADQLGYAVATDTRPVGGVTNTVAGLAPANPDLAGFQDDRHLPWLERSVSVPAPGRHEGARVVLCYHPTTTTPARYLHAALERAGVAVDHTYPDLDLAGLPEDVSAVVIVESPYPALAVSGEASVPVLLWVHHGEIHLYQNIRLAEKYRADGVLLAHSWHLAHRFNVPVFRFPFGVPTEMLARPTDYAERTFDVAMVASGFDATGDRYAARRCIAEELTAVVGPERTFFAGDISPAEMFAAYVKSKVVIDEGGALHRPITMRAFEAIGSGAALLTDPAPGIELLFNPETEFMTLDTSDPVGSFTANRDPSKIAAAGHERALGVHTYDHRVDELFAILSQIITRGGIIPLSTRGQPSAVQGGQQKSASDDVGGSVARRTPLRDSSRDDSSDGARGLTDNLPDFLTAVERFAEIDTIACAEPGEAPFGSSSYIVWSHSDVTDRRIMIDAVLLDNGSAPTTELLDGAHRFVICSQRHVPTVRAMLTQAGRSFTESAENGCQIFDFETPGYILRDAP